VVFVVITSPHDSVAAEAAVAATPKNVPTRATTNAVIVARIGTGEF
jgi:hypothetical protein